MRRPRPSRYGISAARSASTAGVLKLISCPPLRTAGARDDVAGAHDTVENGIVGKVLVDVQES
jgi:hypothetical protein